jgi:hypothetical protein
MRTVVIGLVVLAVGCGRNDGGGGGGSSSPTVDVSALTLFQDYKDNVAAADAKYLNKTIRVSGKVLGNVEKVDGGYAVGFETAPHVMPSGRVLSSPVVAIFPSSRRDEVSKLRDVDQIVVLGKCTGNDSASGHVGGIKITITGARLESHKPYRQ